VRQRHKPRQEIRGSAVEGPAVSLSVLTQTLQPVRQVSETDAALATEGGTSPLSGMPSVAPCIEPEMIGCQLSIRQAGRADAKRQPSPAGLGSR
jgi:hypothetical protein